MRVINKRFETGGIYIGRGSPLGNPYYFGESKSKYSKFRVKDRDEAIQGFSEYFDSAIKSGDPDICDAFRDIQIRKLNGEEIILSCYCAPHSCHGDIILNRLENEKYLINWFSNMRRMDSPLIYRGLEFHTVENIYQAMKTEKSDIEEKRKISLMSPFKSKSYGRRLMVRSDWDQIKIQVMEYALSHKFAPNTSWGEKLKRYNKEIVEWNNWNDTFWGIDLTGNGKNQLGLILTKLHNSLNG